MSPKPREGPQRGRGACGAGQAAGAGAGDPAGRGQGHAGAWAAGQTTAGPPSAPACGSLCWLLCALRASRPGGSMQRLPPGPAPLKPGRTPGVPGSLPGGRPQVAWTQRLVVLFRVGDGGSRGLSPAGLGLRSPVKLGQGQLGVSGAFWATPRLDYHGALFLGKEGAHSSSRP